MNHKQMGLLTTALVIMMLGACSTSYSETAALTDETVTESDEWRDDFSAQRFRADVEFLADDTLEGREAGTRGYQIAANYVAAEYKRLGLKPAGDAGSYFQSVPFTNVVLDIEASSMSVTVSGKTRTLEAGAEFYMAANHHVPDMNVGGDIVFAGYGIYAPSLGHDDLSGLDLDGKIVLLFSGAPSTMNSEVRAHYGSTAGKAIELMKRGATGILILQNKAANDRWNAEAFTRFMTSPSLGWVAQAGTDTTISGRFSALISHDVAGPLFAGAEKSLEDVLADYDAGTMTSFPLLASASAKRVSVVESEITSPNVLAVFEGSDPVLKQEYVIASAHLDHVGVAEGDPGTDLIHNGAMDNATGIATMLEVARNLVASGKRPKRSILFAAVTAEEKGLLGAEYFAHYPTVDKQALVGNVNLDMPVLLYDFADVIAFGAERSSLGPITRTALDEIGIGLTPDPLPEQGLFTRSDHYRFVQQGIPAVFLMTGFEETSEGESGREIFLNFLGTHYHQPSDQPDLPIRYDAGAKFAYVNYLILTAIANEAERPTWNEGDFFGDLFAAE